MEEWRISLYYLGLLPTVFFGLRFLVQWFLSERAGRSHVTPIFWKLSIIGNIIMCFHYLLQLQYPFALFQAVTAVLAWRNINLMLSTSPLPLRRVLIYIVASMIFVTAVFVANALGTGDWVWMRVPVKGDNLAPAIEVSLAWSTFGFIGAVLFASRFWVQWWFAEKSQRSELGKAFWWLSLSGSLLSLIYFCRISDYVSILNQGCGGITYIRNLILHRNPRQKVPL